MSRGTIPTSTEPQPEKPPQSNIDRVKQYVAKLAAPAEPMLWDALRPDERQFLQHWWKISQAELMAEPFDQTVIDNLRPAPRWGANAARGFLVTMVDLAIPFMVGDALDVRVIEKNRRLVIGRDVSPEKAADWVSKGQAKLLPSFIVRCLVSGWPFGISSPADRLERGEIEAREGTTDSRADDYNRLTHIGFEMGFVELVTNFDYRSNPETLGPCPLPRKSTVTVDRQQVHTSGQPPREICVQKWGRDFADPPVIVSSRFRYSVSPEQRPVAKVRALATFSVDGFHFERGAEFEIGREWATRVVADKSLGMKMLSPGERYSVCHMGIEYSHVVASPTYPPEWLPGCVEGDAPLAFLTPLSEPEAA
jgi:hypothetical protein